MGVDLRETVQGKGLPPLLILQLVRGLPEGGLTKSLARGGLEYLGWTQDRYMIADLIDAVNANTAATGNFKKRPKVPTYPRPKKQRPIPESRPVKSNGTVSVKDLHAKFTRS